MRSLLTRIAHHMNETTVDTVISPCHEVTADTVSHFVTGLMAEIVLVPHLVNMVMVDCVLTLSIWSWLTLCSHLVNMVMVDTVFSPCQYGHG